MNAKLISFRNVLKLVVNRSNHAWSSPEPLMASSSNNVIVAQKIELDLRMDYGEVIEYSNEFSRVLLEKFSHPFGELKFCCKVDRPPADRNARSAL